MDRKKTVLALALLAASACFDASAADKPCSRADIGNAARAIDKIVTWSQLRKAYTDFRHCDSGDIADQYTDALMRLFVDWKGVEEFAAAAKGDPDYMKFFIAHLQSPAAKDDRDTVYARAKRECPKSFDDFCAQVADAAHGGSGNATGGDIGIQPLMQPIQVKTVKPDAPKADEKK